MSVSIYYFIFFVISVLILLWAVIYGGSFGANQILFITSVVVGNVGHLALSLSRNLSEALLAVKITYVIGLFAPMFLFVTVCEIYRISIPRILMFFMYGFQFFLFFCVMTIGYSDIFYKSAEYHFVNGIVYLDKVYGPMHAVYIIMMYFYLGALIIVSSGLVPKRRKVSSKDTMAIFLIEFFTIAFYLAERMVNMQIELMPLIYNLALIFVLIPVHRLNTFSLSGSNEAVRRRLDLEGYIFFDKRLHYMGCNEKALELFPELDTWALDKKIPGSGGRFNTYLRQNLYSYLSAEQPEKLKDGSFTMQGENITYRIATFQNNSRHTQGYMIELDRAVSDNEEETN